MKKEIDGIVYDTEKMSELCGRYPIYGRGMYSTMYLLVGPGGAGDHRFFLESGVCDADECRDLDEDLEEMDLDEAKEYFKENAENSYGLDVVDDLDELIALWKDVFGEDIKEW